MTLTVELPQKVSSNELERMHAMKHYPIKKAFYLAVLAAVRRAGIGPVEQYPVLSHYFFQVPGKPLDNLNLAGMAKMVEDGLRHAGIIKNDTPAEVAGAFLSQEPVAGKRIYVTISLVPLE